MQIVPYQEELRPELPTVVGNVDYQEFRATLLRIEEILEQSGLERQWISESLDQYQSKAQLVGRQKVSQKELTRIAKHAVLALRCNIVRQLTGDTCRGFSVRLADSPLLQRFCGIDRIDVVRVPSKSTLDRYAKWAPQEAVRKVVDALSQAATAQGPKGKQPLGLACPLDGEAYFLDTTCVKANIHFPVDWVLLRDAARTLLKAIQVIRRHGLRHRMPEPRHLLRQMNRLAIEMTQTSRGKGDSRRERKRIVRSMKALLQVIRSHASRYRRLLGQRWPETDLSRGQAQTILARIDRVLEQLPAAIAQAQQRILLGKPVENAKKILSLYEPDIHVIARGKAGQAVEFGNTLLLGELPEGLIVDWKLFREQAPADSQLVQGSLDRFSLVLGRPPGALAADRGFDSEANSRRLFEQGVYNATAPKSPRRLTERMQEPRFARLQRRRGQTEARVSIFKNGFLGRPMRSKGFLHRHNHVAWAVLAHNLWVLARLPTAVEQRQKLRRAA